MIESNTKNFCKILKNYFDFFRTKKPLPFGTLGVHKKKEFSEANEAFFIFDCLYYNGESLLRKLREIYRLDYRGFFFFFCLDKTLKERRGILGEHMIAIDNRILLSDLKTINKKSELKHLINFTIAEGLEGLVLKVKKYSTKLYNKIFV